MGRVHSLRQCYVMFKAAIVLWACMCNLPRDDMSLLPSSASMELFTACVSAQLTLFCILCTLPLCREMDLFLSFLQHDVIMLGARHAGCPVGEQQLEQGESLCIG